MSSSSTTPSSHPAALSAEAPAPASAERVSVKYYGQPAPHTHPHLLHPGEVTPGIPKAEYRHRREQLINAVLQSSTSQTRDNHIIIIPASQKVFMSVDVPYPYRQNTEFLYLTGFNEPDSVLVLRSHNKSSFDEVLFVTDGDKNSELWDGPCAGVHGAKDLSGIEQVCSMHEFEGFLAKYLRDNSNFVLWYDFIKPVNAKIHDSHIKRLLDEQKHSAIDRPTSLIHTLRSVKSQNEVKLMRRTCDIAAMAMNKTIASSRPGISEGHLFATMDYESRIGGADCLAYPPVVAGGNRACTIHYIHNNNLVHNDELVLMDAGCELAGYCSDMTRTWPVNGRFGAAQRALYDAVLNTQEVCIEACKPLVTLDHLYMLMLRVLSQHLQKLRLVSPDLIQQDAMRVTRQFCPHHVGHWLGMDVHDCSQVNKSSPLLPNMVITIEPGLYIPENRVDIPEEYRGIGIRIEDDILITDSGCENLTGRCPKRPGELESLVLTNS